MRLRMGEGCAWKIDVRFKPLVHAEVLGKKELEYLSSRSDIREYMLIKVINTAGVPDLNDSLKGLL